MAGGQERVLRRRIRSVQSTRKITKAMELIAASRIVRAQARIAANRPYRVGMEKILREAAAADPTAAKKLLGTPEAPTGSGSWPSWATAGLPARTTPASCGPPSAWWPSTSATAPT